MHANGPVRDLDNKERVVLNHLADGRPLTASEISAAAGLARSTVLQALTRLESAAAVRRHVPASAARGRPARRWSATRDPGLMAVVVPAAHGTLVSVVSADGEVLSLSDQVRKGVGPTPAVEVLDTVDAALGRAGATADDIGLAVLGLPGASEFNDGGELPPSPSRHLRRFRDWNGQSPAAILSQHLGCPTFTENDANLAALGEAHVGAGTGMGTVLFVGMVHGTGSGLVLDGRLHRGRAGLAGEIGHLHTSDDGRLCECGARGCFWQTRSIPALLDELSTLERRTFTIEDLSESAARGEPDVVRALQGLGEALGRRLADAVVFLDPDIVIVDSALADAAEAVTDGIRIAVHRCAPAEMVRGLKITTGELGCAAHVHGALALARTHGLWGAAASSTDRTRDRHR